MKRKNQKTNVIKQQKASAFVIRTLEEQQKDSKNPHLYAFYEEYHDSSYAKHNSDSTVRLKEPGENRIYYLHNDNKKDLVVYAIDGGLYKSQAPGDSKCDFGIYTEDELLILIELKGTDYKKAIQQITNTATNVLGLTGSNKIKRLLARTVLSNGRNVPNVTTTDLAKLKQLITRYNGGFKDEYIGKSTKVLEENLSKI